MTQGKDTNPRAPRAPDPSWSPDDDPAWCAWLSGPLVGGGWSVTAAREAVDAIGRPLCIVHVVQLPEQPPVCSVLDVPRPGRPTLSAYSWATIKDPEQRWITAEEIAETFTYGIGETPAGFEVVSSRVVTLEGARVAAEAWGLPVPWVARHLGGILGGRGHK